MGDGADGVRVTQPAGAGFPIGFWWRGRRFRVLGLESLRVAGCQQRYRLSTVEGCFELVLDGARAEWRLGRAPGRMERWRARLQYGARYPLPSWRRRTYRPPSRAGEPKDACPAKNASVRPAHGDLASA